MCFSSDLLGMTVNLCFALMRVMNLLLLNICAIFNQELMFLASHATPGADSHCGTGCCCFLLVCRQHKQGLASSLLLPQQRPLIGMMQIHFHLNLMQCNVRNVYSYVVPRTWVTRVNEVP